MSNKELADAARKALDDFKQLPPEEQVKRLMASGTINERGEVLMGRDISYRACADGWNAGVKTEARPYNALRRPQMEDAENFAWLLNFAAECRRAGISPKAAVESIIL